jgi:hypothetical protein
LSADLTPRSKLRLLWRANDAPSGDASPLLSARGEIAIDLGAGTLRTRSSWSVRSIRGITNTLEVTVDPDDEILDVDLDGQPAKSTIERVGEASRITIPLVEPLSTGQERKLVLATRRLASTSSPSRLIFRGFPFFHAREQTGTIGVSRGADLWVSGSIRGWTRGSFAVASLR